MSVPSAAELARAVRAGAGLFALPGRALVEVNGGDRVRWLQGQISNDVTALSEGEGCYATVLTVKGRIVADVHVLARAEGFWLEMDAAVREAIWQRLDRYIVADDVTLTDASARFERLALEGPKAGEVLAAAGGPSALAPGAALCASLAGHETVVWAFGFTNLPAFQLLVPLRASADVRAALELAGADHGLVAGGSEVLEILRIESGIPGTGSELDEEVFPAEARLDRAVSTTKGCYTGQEIVERIRSRGAVNFLLVGLRFEGAPPDPGSALTSAEGKRVGEVTSVAVSADAGPIALGYVRRELEAPGTELQSAAGPARVVALPFVGAAPG